MIDLQQLSLHMRETALAPWFASLQDQLDLFFKNRLHGEFHEWMDTIAQLPEIPAPLVDLNNARVGVRSGTPRDSATLTTAEKLLRTLHPWRKGPYSIHGIEIDTEWRSDWKWDRLTPHITPLKGRVVLDVGCGNGYHCWRMAGEGAKLVIGIDPTQRYLAQFLAIRHFLGKEWPVCLLPFASEELPRDLRAFDAVFSMGIPLSSPFSHRSPVGTQGLSPQRGRTDSRNPGGGGPGRLGTCSGGALRQDAQYLVYSLPGHTGHLAETMRFQECQTRGCKHYGPGGAEIHGLDAV